MLSATVLLATLLYAAIGLIVFVVGFLLWDKFTPVDLWGEICENQNVALANLVAGIAIAIAIIIAAAIHG